MNGLRTFIALLALLSAGQIAYGATEISGNIEGDTVWSLIDSPYIIQDNTNFSADTPGATLTIEPGVEVRFAPGSGLNIFGNLISNGTESARIKFISSESNGSWRVNIFSSPDSQLSYVTTESLQGTVATYSSDVTIRHVSGNSQLMLFDGFSDLSDLNITNNRLFVNGDIAVVDKLTITGGNSSFFDTDVTLTNASISNANSTAIFLSDRPATLNNVQVSNAEGGIIANDVPSLQLKDVSIANITNYGSAIAFDGGTAGLSGVSISNSYYGAGLLGSSVSLRDVHITGVQSPALQVNAHTIGITNSSFTNGANTGVSLRGDTASLQNVTISGFLNAPALLPETQSMEASRLVMTDNLIGLYHYNSGNSGTTTIRQSKITGNSEAGVMNGSGHVDARQTYWGHPDGPTLGNPNNPSTAVLGDAIIGDVMYEPWLTEFCETDCHSNIMFLPGIMSSRLYENGEQLWEGRDSEVARLHLDATGKSISNRIVTRDTIETFDAPLFFNRNIYASFLNDIENAKTTGVINDYASVPYDWRLALLQILSSGIMEPNGNISYLEATNEPHIEKTLRELAVSSKSGKVTIVAHSNGGLLTKALINSLGDEASGLIDQIILVAVPQLGTPKAIGSLLHGYDTGISLMLSDEAARAFAQNSPMTYHLLPFSDYYSGSGHTIGTPYVTFDDGSMTQTFINEYGYAITNAGELYSFLTAAEGRTTPSYSDTYKPTIANKILLDEAIAIQSTINSTWKPPSGIKIHQIAGTGAHTPARIHYETTQECKMSVVVCIGGYEDILSYDVEEVIDGDGTVVLPSALAISDDERIKRWWVNLETYNAPAFGANRTHADILEIDELRDFIFENLITNAVSVLPNYISSTEPSLQEKDRLIFTLHSPLSLSAIDPTGRVVNEQEVTIPGAHYARYGEIQKLSVPTGIKFTLILTGEAEGSFTLKAIETRNKEIAKTITLSAIPSATSTIAELDFDNGSLDGVGALLLDYDGDGIVEATYTPMLNKIVTTSDLLIAEERVPSGGKSRSKAKGISSPQDLEVTVKLIQLIADRLNELNNTGTISLYQYENTTRQLQQILIKILIELNKINAEAKSIPT